MESFGVKIVLPSPFLLLVEASRSAELQRLFLSREIVGWELPLFSPPCMKFWPQSMKG